MRVRIDEDLRICPEGHYMELRAGDVVDGPLAVWLADVSGCPVTVLDRDPAGGGVQDDGTKPPEGESPQGDNPEGDGAPKDPDGSLSADLTAASGVTAGAKDAAPKSGAKGK